MGIRFRKALFGAMGCVLAVGLLGLTPSARAQASGVVVEWAPAEAGYTYLSEELSNVAAISAGASHNLALKKNGTVIAWGKNFQGECSVPADLSGVIQVFAGNNYSLAVKSNGTVVSWGSDREGTISGPAAALREVVAVAGSRNTPLIRLLALKSDGTVVAWGPADVAVPQGLSGVRSIAVGNSHYLALKSDGTVVAWGDNTSGQATVPADLSGVTAIAAGSDVSFALKSNGRVTAWGSNDTGQMDIPSDLDRVIAIASGGGSALALQDDGQAVAWGTGLLSGFVPPPTDLHWVTEISAGRHHFLALTGDPHTFLDQGMAARLESLNAAIATRASQTTADTILSKVNSLDLAPVSASIHSRASQASVDALTDLVVGGTQATLLGDMISVRAEVSAGNVLYASTAFRVQAGPQDLVTYNQDFTVDAEAASIRIQFSPSFAGFGGVNVGGDVLPDFRGIVLSGIDSPVFDASFESDIPAFAANRLTFTQHSVSANLTGLGQLGGKHITIHVNLNTLLADLKQSVDVSVSSRASQAAIDAIQTQLGQIAQELSVTQSTEPTTQTTTGTGPTTSGTSQSTSGTSQSTSGTSQSTSGTSQSTSGTSQPASGPQQVVQRTIGSIVGSALDTNLASRASQASLDSLRAKVDGFNLSALDTVVSTRASQPSIDALQVTANAISARVTSLNPAQQSSVDALQTKLALLETAITNNETKAEAFRDLNLRALIEADLAAGATRERIALFYLPALAGGQLEFVRDIVADNILLHKTAALGLGKAEAEFAKGNTFLAGKKYRDAYDQYRKAYLELIH